MAMVFPSPVTNLDAPNATYIRCDHSRLMPMAFCSTRREAKCHITNTKPELYVYCIPKRP